MFSTNAILEILQVCSNELAKEDEHFQSIWTLDGIQVTDLNDLEDDCKMCLVSHLPMVQNSTALLQSRTKKLRQLNSSLDETFPLKKATAMTGLKGNEYAVASWKDYYQHSLKRTERGLKSKKESWFQNEHKAWAITNSDVLEEAHLREEFNSQQRDPRLTSQYVKKEPDSRHN